MRWLKRDIWKAGIALAGMLLLLVLMVWVPVSAAGVYEGVSGLATPVTGVVQATPTVDATVAALNKEKLAQEVQQLKNQNASDLFGWLRMNAAVLLSTLVVVIGGLIGLFRWLGDRRDEQEKRREDQRTELEKRAEECDLAPDLWKRESLGYTLSEGGQGSCKRFKKRTHLSSSAKRFAWHRPVGSRLRT